MVPSETQSKNTMLTNTSTSSSSDTSVTNQQIHTTKITYFFSITDIENFGLNNTEQEFEDNNTFYTNLSSPIIFTENNVNNHYNERSKNSGFSAFEQERLDEEENRKIAVVAANSKHSEKEDVDLYPDRDNSRRLNIRLDKCQVKYFDKKEKLKYETVDAYHPDNTPTRSILKKKITKK